MKAIARICMYTALVSGLCMAYSAKAELLDDKDVVIDARGNVVTNTFGNCVRTKWDGGQNACGARSYLVFFDFDRSAITTNANQTIHDLHQSVGSNNRFEVTGHADRSGSDSYNMALSERRAAAVKGELMRHGVHGNDVSVDFRGERDTLVATDDGIREPQNRRAEIRVQRK